MIPPQTFRIKGATIRAFLHPSQSIRETPSFEVFFENEADDQIYENLHPEAERPFLNWGEVIKTLAFQEGKSPVMEIHALLKNKGTS